MDGRGDDVRRRLVRQLNDYFPKIRFDDLQTVTFKRIVQVRLFRCHAFAFDYGMRTALQR